MLRLFPVCYETLNDILGPADFAPGSTSDPMSYDAVAEKFQGCADHAGWPENKARQAIELVRNLGDLENLAPLTLAMSV